MSKQIILDILPGIPEDGAEGKFLFFGRKGEDPAVGWWDPRAQVWSIAGRLSEDRPWPAVLLAKEFTEHARWAG